MSDPTTSGRNGQQPGEQQPGASRRQFLTNAGYAGLAGVAVACAPHLLGQPARTDAARRGSLAAQPTTADWNALRASLSTKKLVRPGQTGYAQDKQLFEPQFDTLQPAGIAYCRTVTDVGKCLAFVRTFALAVRVRSGGHSYAGWSSVTGGLVIDVSLMNSFRTGNGTVTVGTGLDLIHFYDQLAAKGLSVPGGSCPTVGIAGLALGGGVGVISRLQGLTSDNLRSIQVVTANGSVLDCDSTHHSDLYWACRGGGGGNFGVATSFTFGTHKLTKLVVFFLTWPWSKASKVLNAWQSWAPSAPDALWSNMHLSASFGGGPSLSVGGTYAGSTAAASAQLNGLFKLAGSRPSTLFLRQESYLNVMLLEAGCSTIPLNACHTGSGGKLGRVPSYAHSDFFTRKLDAAGISAVLAGIEQIDHIHGAAGGAGTIALDACGGAMNRVSPSATAFVHRNALFLAQYSTVWNWPGSSAGVASQHKWLDSYYKSVHPHASGQAYQNYIDPSLADWEQAYYGANYARLQQVKAAYDPHNLFSFPQSVRLP